MGYRTLHLSRLVEGFSVTHHFGCYLFRISGSHGNGGNHAAGTGLRFWTATLILMICE